MCAAVSQPAACMCKSTVQHSAFKVLLAACMAVPQAPHTAACTSARRLLGVLGMWGGIARRCLQDLLPEDAHQRWEESGRLLAGA